MKQTDTPPETNLSATLEDGTEDDDDDKKGGQGQGSRPVW